MSDSYRPSQTAYGTGLLLDKVTGVPISGLVDVTVKILNPDGTILLPDRECIELANNPGRYRFIVLAAERSQIGKYDWVMTSPAANLERDIDGSFISGAEADVYGSEAVSVLVRDSITLLGIPDVSFSLYDSLGEVLWGLGKTNPSGYVVLDGRSVPGFSLDLGNYIIRLTKAMVSFDPEYPIIVTITGPNDFTLEGTSLVIEPPSDPGICRIYGNIKDLGLLLRDIERVELRFSITKAPQKSEDIIVTATALVLNKNTGTGGAEGLYFNTATGEFWIDIARGVWAKVCCSIADLDDAEFKVPDQATASLLSLIPSIFTA